MNKKEQILKLYFEEHKTQEQIAKEVSVTQSYVSQVVKSDPRLKKKKEDSAQESKQKKKAYNKGYWQHYKRKKSNDMQEYEQLKAMLDKDVQDFSYNKGISDYAFAKWNRGMYNYDKNSSDLVLKKNITVSLDVSKRIRNVVSPSCIKATI